MTIPASAIVRINPGVLSAGCSALDLRGLIMTRDTAVPLGAVKPFSNPDDVKAFFGATTPEARYAEIYFSGYDNSPRKPGSLLFAQVNNAAVAGYLRGGSLTEMTLAQLKAITGTVIVPVDGVQKTSTSLNLTAATSFSSAAAIIQTALGTGQTVIYDAQRAGFVITSATTGVSSSVGFATGTASAALKLTSALGAVTSAGAAPAVTGAAMDAIKQKTQNWASFMTTFEPADVAAKMEYAAWANAQGNRYLYVGWDTDVLALTAGSTATFGAALAAGNYSGTMPVYKDPEHAAFILGAIAAIDFARRNGRITLAFKSQSGLLPSIDTESQADALIANGYNFYGAYATANDQFIFLYPGQVSGQYDWADPFVNQIWLNNGLQLALMTLLTTAPSIPYNAEGKAMTEQACMDPINAALFFGAIRRGVTLSALQKSQINSAAGRDIDTVLSSRGWYLLIDDASPEARAARATFPMTFFYMDGGSVHKLTLASIAVQ